MKYHKYIGIVLSFVITALVLTSYMGVSTAQDSPSLMIENLQGSIVSNNRVLVSGSIHNTLPWQVQNVRVTAVIRGGTTTKEGETLIASINPDARESFTIEVNIVGINIVGNEARFGTVVTGFSLQTNDIDELLSFFQRDDPPLRQAIIGAFNHVSEDATPALLHCVDVAERSSIISDQRLIEDLLCLNGIYITRIPEAIEPLMNLMVLYEQQDNDLWLMLSGLLANSDNTVFHSLQLITTLPAGTYTTNEVFKSVFAEIGELGLPEFIRSVADENVLIQDMATEMLSTLGEQQLNSLLDETDPELLNAIIRAVAEINYQEPVIPLLELAISYPNQQITIETSLLNLGNIAVPQLVDALSHSQQAVADLAEALLRRQADDIIPLLTAELPNQEPWTSTPADIDSLVTALRDWSNENLNVQMEVIYEQGVAAFEGGNCIEAADLMMEMLAIRDQTQHLDKTSEILFCAAQYYATEENYDEAVLLGQQASRLIPEDSQLRSQLAGWLVQEGRISLDIGNLDNARDNYRMALEYAPDDLSARNGLVMIMFHQNRIYLVAFGLFMVFFFLRSRKSWKSDE